MFSRRLDPCHILDFTLETAGTLGDWCLWTICNRERGKSKMSEIQGEIRYDRLEDFIALAKDGKQVKAEIELNKQIVKQKVHPDETDNMGLEVDMYLLSGNYFLTGVEDEVKRISKVYVFASTGESLVESQTNRKIANARLKMDYDRLAQAGIKFEEKYF